MDGFGVGCPLCSGVFEVDGDYAAHLADAHGLVDDEGTATTLEQAVVSSGGWAAMARVVEGPAQEPEPVAVTRPAMVVDLASVDPGRLFDPDHDDARWRVMVIAFAGAALLGAVAASQVL